ncbi:MAG: hypothetical protein V3S46_06285 [Nitrospinota bacterium]
MDNPEYPEMEIQTFVMEAIVKAANSTSKAGVITINFYELLSDLGMDMTSTLPEKYLERIANALRKLEARGFKIEQGDDDDGIFTITLPKSR